MSDPQSVAAASARAMYEQDRASQSLGMRILEVRPGYARLAMKIREDMVRALRLPDVQQKLAAQAWDSIGNTPTEFAAVIKSDNESWTKVIRTAGIRAE